MADNYLQFSESLEKLTPKQTDWLRRQLEEDPRTNCPMFLLDYADREPDDTDYGFQHDFQGHAPDRYLWISAEERGDVERVAHLVQKFLRQFRPDQCWSLTYATTCSKLRLGEFGGGAVFVTAEDIRLNDSYDFVQQQRKAFERRKHREIRLPCYGITIRLKRSDSPGSRACGTISSELKVPGNNTADRLHNAAIDGIKSLILAHACTGIDIESPDYVEAVQTVVDAIANQYGQ